MCLERALALQIIDMLSCILAQATSALVLAFLEGRTGSVGPCPSL